MPGLLSPQCTLVNVCGCEMIQLQFQPSSSKSSLLYTTGSFAGSFACFNCCSLIASTCVTSALDSSQGRRPRNTDSHSNLWFLHKHGVVQERSQRTYALVVAHRLTIAGEATASIGVSLRVALSVVGTTSKVTSWKGGREG